MSLIEGFISLARSINKAKGEFAEETQEGVASEQLGELSLDKEDDELIELSKTWKNRWETSESRKELERKQKENERYWLGDHYTSSQKQTGKKEPIDNLIFESLETFLPTANKQNPEPIVSASKDPQARIVAKKIEQRLIDIADVIRLKLKIRKATRHWVLYYLGVIKMGWSVKNNEIAIKVIRPQLLILDPDAITDECEYDGEYLGEYKTDTAVDLISRFPDKETIIKDKIGKDKLGTKLRYIEWWTNEYLFWELEGKILGKNKNPHWNYDSKQPQKTVDEYGVETENEVDVPGVNFFSNQKIPYAFLSVFNLGKGPVDDTSLIEQVIPTQDVVNKRTTQIDRNADGMNAGAVVSGDVFTKEQAKQVGDALRKGQTVWVPRGNVNNVYKRDAGVALPQFVYQSLIDSRNEIRNIFGTSGLSSSGIKSEETVRGKILIKGSDTDRASLVVDYLEQFADYIFNWMVQLMFVYYDEPRNVSKSQGDETIINTELFPYSFGVSVKEGSMIPKDSLTERNEAVDLWSANAISAVELYEKLDFPNPRESAKNLLLWQMVQKGVLPPQILFPDFPVPQIPQVIGEQPREIAPEAEVESSNLLDSVPIQ